MTNRLLAALIAALVAGCIAVPCAFASGSGTTQTTSAADETLKMISSVKSVHVGMNSTTVTFETGSKTHPIVIDYGDALKTGVPAANANEPASGIARSGAAVASVLPKSFSLGQVAVWLLGLSFASRVIRVVRQVMPRRVAH